MASVSSYDAERHELTRYFRLESADQLPTYFATNKHHVFEMFLVRVKRIIHYVFTGIWISESRLCDWVWSHKNAGISTLFATKHLERKLRRCEEGIYLPSIPFWVHIGQVLRFIKEEILDYHCVGAILPSSKYLAKEIVSEIPKDPSAPKRRILEIGPGTGAFTDKIISRMNPGDELHLVEYDAKFCAILRRKYGHLPQVKIFQQSILDYTADQPYDYVVSGLPLNAFEPEAAEKIFSNVETLTKQGGRVSYFDYNCLMGVWKVFQRNKSTLATVNAVTKMKDRFFDQCGLRKAVVVRNIPPARVVHHRLP